MTQDLLTQIDGPVATITFNRPAARNATTQEMLVAMREFLASVARDRSVRCVVITGAGDHFQAGGDVIGFAKVLKDSPEERRRNFETRIGIVGATFQQMERTPQPIVVKIRGATAGAALGIVSGADFAVCAENSIFILAHVKIGASPDGGSSYWLPRTIGVRKAKELAILGDKIDAAEALRIGLVTHVVPTAELDARVDALVQRICAAPAESARRAKLLMDRSLENTLARQLELEAQSFAACAATDDFIEGVSAFAEKRAAVFNKTR